MKPRLFVLLFIAALLLALGSIAAGCGGDDELTLEEYFQRLDTLGDDLDDELDRLGEEFDETFVEAESEEEVMRAFRDFLDPQPALFEEFVAELESIDPPPKVEDAHDEMVAIQAEGLEMLEDLNEHAQAAESASDVEELEAELETPAFTAISDRTERVCFELEAIADANDIDVDLECEE
jgi:hypothetical protein